MTHKSVAHLWAAVRAAKQAAEKKEDGSICDISDLLKTSILLSPRAVPDRLLKFLSFAEYFRRMGTTIIPHSRTAPLLNPGETWQVPSTVQLAVLEMEPPSLEDWAIKILDNYQAPKRLY
jgi:hypothetical protein